MAGFGGAVKLTGESEYRKALSQITQSLKVVSSEMKATASSFASGEKSEAELAQSAGELSKALNVQKQALSTLKAQLATMQSEYNKSGAAHQQLVEKYESEKTKLEQIKNTLGTSSAEYKAQEKVVGDLAVEVAQSEKAYESQGKALNDMRIKTANAETTVNQTSQALDNLGQEAVESGKDAEKAGGGFTVMKGVLANLATDAIRSAISGLKNLGGAVKDAVAEVGAMGDDIDKSSQKLGLSSDTYQELSYAMERSGASIDDVSKGMKNITNAIAGTQDGVKGASSDFDKLGVSLTNADGSMKSSEQVLMDSIDALSSMSDETQRNALANDIFGKSYQELSPLLNSGSDGIKDLMQEAQDYGMVMSGDAVDASAKYADSLNRMQGTVTGLKNNLLGAFLPSLTDVIDGFTDLARGSDGAEDKIKTGVQGMISQFQSMLPQLTNIITSVAQTVLAVAPEVISSLMTGILDALPQLMPIATQVITTLVTSLVSLLPQILDTGIKIIVELIHGLTDAIPQLVEMLPDIINSIVTVLIENLPLIVTAGMQLLMGLIDHLSSADKKSASDSETGGANHGIPHQRVDTGNSTTCGNDTNYYNHHCYHTWTGFPKDTQDWQGYTQ